MTTTVGVKALAQSLGLALSEQDLVRVLRDGQQDIEQELLVHETWFFRDPTMFQHLVEAARMLAKEHPFRPLRILSAPCSTGEEVYSIAIALKEAGFSAGSFLVVGVDVSLRAIEAARKGCYRRSALRSIQHDWEQRWLVAKQATGHDAALELTIADELRACVHFERQNLLAPVLTGMLHDKAPFDIVLCRNLAIYLTTDARMQLWSLLHRLLGGILYIGGADALDDPRFERAGPAGTFAYRQVNSSLAPNPPSTRRPTTAPLTKSLAVTEDLFEATHRLADAGQLVAARALCLRVLEAQPLHASGQALLGTIESALGRPELAQAAWRKAIFIDPHHPVALVQLALYWQQHGDPERAAVLLQRAAEADHES